MFIMFFHISWSPLGIIESLAEPCGGRACKVSKVALQ